MSTVNRAAVLIAVDVRIFVLSHREPDVIFRQESLQPGDLGIGSRQRLGRREADAFDCPGCKHFESWVQLLALLGCRISLGSALLRGVRSQ